VYTTNPPNKLQATHNAVDLTMDLLLSRPANTSEKQPIPNLKTWISANPTDTSEKLKFALFFCFSTQIYRSFKQNSVYDRKNRHAQCICHKPANCLLTFIFGISSQLSLTFSQFRHDTFENLSYLTFAFSYFLYLAVSTCCVMKLLLFVVSSLTPLTFLSAHWHPLMFASNVSWQLYICISCVYVFIWCR